jgi:hypothetical protein
MKLVCVTIALVLAAAPAYAQEPNAATDKQAPAEVTVNEAHQWVVLFDKVVDAVVANKNDCMKMASGLHAVVDANQQTIAMARDAKAKGKKLPVSAQQHMLDSARRMVDSLEKCGRDEAVGLAFKRIDLGSRS